MLYNKTCVTGHAIRVNDLFANFHAFAKTGDLGPLCKTIIACSILFEAFESRNKELCNKNCSYRPMKGELKHILYKNINIYRILAAEHIHSFNPYPFLWPFKHVESYVPKVSLAVQMPRVTCLKFLVSHLNSWHHPFEILVSRSNGCHHPFKVFH